MTTKSTRCRAASTLVLDARALAPEYSEVQKASYDVTLETEEDSLRSTDQSLSGDGCRESRPTLRGREGHAFGRRHRG